MPKSAREKDLDPDTFIGIGLPLGYSSKGFFKQTKTSLEQAGHNIRNLLLTIPGERVNQPEFGSRLHHLLFEQVDDDFIDEVEMAIRDAIEQWLPYITLDSIEIQEPDVYDAQTKNEAHIKLRFGLAFEPDRLEELTFILPVGF